MNDVGISKYGDILDVGAELGIIGKSGSFFNYEGNVIAQGREAAKEYLRENEKLAMEIEKKIRETAQSGKKIPVELGEEKDEEE
jgi:recombination protein RecA